MPSQRSLPLDFLRTLAACLAIVALPLAVPSAERPELVFLAMLLAPALLATAWLAPRPGAEFGFAATLSVTAAWAIPPSPTRASFLAVVAALALGVAAARRARIAPWTLGEWGILLVALQTLCRGDRLLQPGFVPGGRLRLLAILIFLPALAAVAGWTLAALGRGWGIAATGVAFLLQGGLHVANTLGLVALAGLAYLMRSRLPRFSSGRIPAAAVGLLAAVVIPIAAYPWLAPRPLAAALALPGEVLAAARAREILPGGELLLTAAAPAWEAPLEQPVRELVVVSNLANAAGLAPGVAVAVVELQGEGGEILRWTLRNGHETGEWAARRPDVVAPAPPAWRSVVAGEFFAQRYRASRPIEPRRITRLRLIRDPTLPPQIQVAIFSLEARR